MSKYFIILIAVLFLSSCENNNSKLPTDMVNNPISADGLDKNAKTPEITFKKKDHDFGKIIQGEVVSYGFKFTNTGKADLIITKVSTSCGCTASKYPVDPIAPGETKLVEAKFDSQGRIGFQNKRISVLTNASPAKTNLYIKAEVIKPGQ